MRKHARGAAGGELGVAAGLRGAGDGSLRARDVELRGEAGVPPRGDHRRIARARRLRLTRCVTERLAARVLEERFDHRAIGAGLAGLDLRVGGVDARRGAAERAERPVVEERGLDAERRLELVLRGDDGLRGAARAIREARGDLELVARVTRARAQRGQQRGDGAAMPGAALRGERASLAVVDGVRARGGEEVGEGAERGA